jgi:3-hydroxymyristoyl/3-hydroxydecanoyl-(acyl carrier protein) dehydratase
VNDTTIHARVLVDARHPSLPGHFPGNPVVPGVVLLDRVEAALQHAGMGRLRRVFAVKFLAPLLPGQAADLTATRTGSRVRFRIERNGMPVLNGDGELDD